MSNAENMKQMQEFIERTYWGDEEKQLLIPIFTELLNYSDIAKILSIINELLNDDPLVDRITKIYEEGSTLWFALNK